MVGRDVAEISWRFRFEEGKQKQTFEVSGNDLCFQNQCMVKNHTCKKQKQSSKFEGYLYK